MLNVKHIKHRKHTQPISIDKYLSAWWAVWLHLGGHSKGVHAKRSKQSPHLLPMSCKWIPGRNRGLH